MKIAPFLFGALGASKNFTEIVENHQNLTGSPVLSDDDILISAVFQQEKGNFKNFYFQNQNFKLKLNSNAGGRSL